MDLDLLFEQALCPRLHCLDVRDGSLSGQPGLLSAGRAAFKSHPGSRSRTSQCDGIRGIQCIADQAGCLQSESTAPCQNEELTSNHRQNDGYGRTHRQEEPCRRGRKVHERCTGHPVIHGSRDIQHQQGNRGGGQESDVHPHDPASPPHRRPRPPRHKSNAGQGDHHAAEEQRTHPRGLTHGPQGRVCSQPRALPDERESDQTPAHLMAHGSLTGKQPIRGLASWRETDHPTTLPRMA